MALAGNNHNIVLFSQLHSSKNSLTTVNNIFMRLAANGFLYPGLNHIKDSLRVLTTRIIGGSHHIIRLFSGNPSHNRPFGIVSITTTTKYCNNPPLSYLSGSFQNIFQAVRSMGIIHNNSKILSSPYQLKTARYRSKFFHTALDNRTRYSLSQSCTYCCHYIINVEDTSNLQLQWQMSLTNLYIKLSTTGQNLYVFSLQGCFPVNGIGNMAAFAMGQHILSSRIINVHHSGFAIFDTWLRNQIKENGLGLFVIFQSFVIIQMILSKISKDSCVKFNPGYPILV